MSNPLSHFVHTALPSGATKYYPYLVRNFTKDELIDMSIVLFSDYFMTTNEAWKFFNGLDKAGIAGYLLYGANALGGISLIDEIINFEEHHMKKRSKSKK